MNVLDELNLRGITKDVTNEQKLLNLSSGAGVYVGFDPTAESLHLGNYLQITILKRFESFGFKPFAVLGGATGMIGDPSGKSKERNLLSEEDLEKNKSLIKKQLEKCGLNVIDNLSFYKNMSMIDFLRNIGKLININYMMQKEVVSSRLDEGISFTEFSYQLIQGWDFKELFEKENVKIQVGGSDQWGNITTGLEIIRKVFGDKHDALGITTNLMTTSNGQKFGKSEGNAIWIDSSKTLPYTLYQYLKSTDDRDVEAFLKWLTFLSIEEINEIVERHKISPNLQEAQKKLAFEVTKDIHGQKAAKNAIMATNIVFGNVSHDTLSSQEALSIDGLVPTFENIIGNILDVLVQVNLASSKREAKEFVVNGAIFVNGKQIKEPEFLLEKDMYEGKANIIKRGKKKIILIKY